MTHRIHIDDSVSGRERWIYHNDRKSHLLSESLLKEIKRDAKENLWANDPVHGRLLGHKLFQLLNGSGGLLEGLGKAQVETGEAATLGLQLPDDLMNLPFEVMWDGDSFVSLDGNMPIIRQVSGRNRRKKIALENRPVRMLFMACSPQDTEPVLNFEGEEDTIVRQLVELGATQLKRPLVKYLPIRYGNRKDHHHSCRQREREVGRRSTMRQFLAYADLLKGSRSETLE